MRSLLIRCAVFAITLIIIEVVMTRLKSGGSAVRDGQSDMQYLVTPPSAVRWAGFVMFGFGILLFLFFLFFRLKGNEGTTKGHLVFFLVFAAAGLLIAVYASSWKLAVDGDQLVVSRFLHRSRSFSVSEISKTERDKKGQIALFLDGKRVIVVSPICDNFNRLIKTLEENGKL